MPAQPPIPLPNGNTLQVNDMQSGVLSPQEAIAFGNPKATNGLEEASGLILSRSGKSIVVEPKIDISNDPLKYEADHFVIKRYYKDPNQTLIPTGSYPDAAATWRLQDEYYIGNGESKSGSEFVKYTTTTPTLPTGQSTVIRGPIGFLSNKKTITGGGVVYDMQIEKYTAVDKIADINAGATYKARVKRQSDTGTSSSFGDVKITYQGTTDKIVVDLVPISVGVELANGAIVPIDIFAYKVWNGDRPPTQQAKKIKYSPMSVSVTQDLFGKYFISSSFIRRNPPDPTHNSIQKDGETTGAIRLSANVGPVITGTIVNKFGPGGTYALDENDAQLEVGSAGNIYSLESAEYWYSASYDLVIPKNIGGIGWLNRIVDTNNHYIHMTWSESKKCYISNMSEGIRSIDSVYTPSGFSTSRIYSTGSGHPRYCYFNPGTTVTYNTDVVLYKKDYEPAVKDAIHKLDNPFTGDILGNSSYPGRVTDGTQSTVFYFNNKTLVRGIRRFGPVAILGNKTSGAAATTTQTIYAIGATHNIYTDPLADTSQPINTAINNLWPGAYSATFNVGTYQAALDKKIWLYTDKTGSTGGYNGVGGTNGFGGASAYVIATDTEVMWMESTYQGIMYGTTNAEFVLVNDQDALQVQAQKIGQTGSTSKFGFQRSTSCIYKGNVFFISSIGITSISFSNEAASYIPKSASFYGRINTGDIVSIQSDEVNNCIVILTHDSSILRSDIWYWFPENDAVFKSNQTDSINRTSTIAYGFVKINGEIIISMADNFTNPTTFTAATFSKKERSSAGGYLRTTRFGMSDGRNSIVKKIYMTLINSAGGRQRVITDDAKHDFRPISYPIEYASSPYFTGVVELFADDGANVKSSGKRVEIEVGPGEEFEVSSIRAEVKT